MTTEIRTGRNKSLRQQALSTALAQRLRRLRLNQVPSLSQEALGNAIGVSFQMVQKYEKGECQLTPAQVVIAAETLGVSLSYLLTGSDAEQFSQPLDLAHIKQELMEWQSRFERKADPKTAQIAKNLLETWMIMVEPSKPKVINFSKSHG